MMVRLAPPSESVGHRAIEKILATLAKENLRLPRSVLVDDGDGGWRRHAALLPVEERRSTVIAALTGACLIDAARFEIGGASWLPSSTPSLEAACEAAAEARRLKIAPYATRGVVESVISGAETLWAIGWWPQSWWHDQLGPGRMSASLTAVADRLGCDPCIVDGPVLLVAVRDRPELEAAWREETDSSSSIPRTPPAIIELSAALDPAEDAAPVERVLAAVAGRWSEEPVGSVVTPPVLELPSGRRVGRWSRSIDAPAGGPGWLATPVAGVGGADRWRFAADDGSAEILTDSILPSDQASAGQSVIRVPGWIGAGLRFGSPAGLLVDRLAGHERRAGRPLWVPNVDDAGVRFLLTLPGPIWVDGPGVPS